jgi:hypothetical protein
MDKLEHHPQTKSQIKDAIYDFLYQPVQRQFKARIDTLIGRNTVMGGHSHKHFVYKGVVYNADATNPPLKKNRLVPALRADMEDCLKDLHELNNKELPYVIGFLNQVLNASNDLTDYLRVLPESVHYPLDQLMSTCPCRSASLNDEKVEALKAKNVDSIQLMRRRPVINLLM